MMLNQIIKFENLNDISINVRHRETKGNSSITTHQRKRDKHVNLLYLQNPRDDNAGHFVFIKKFLPLHEIANQQ